MTSLPTFGNPLLRHWCVVEHGSLFLILSLTSTTTLSVTLPQPRLQHLYFHIKSIHTADRSSHHSTNHHLSIPKISMTLPKDDNDIIKADYAIDTLSATECRNLDLEYDTPISPKSHIVSQLSDSLRQCVITDKPEQATDDTSLQKCEASTSVTPERLAESDSTPTDGAEETSNAPHTIHERRNAFSAQGAGS